jgi:hypothetical protein
MYEPASIGGYRLVSKIKDEGFDADLYIKHCCTWLDRMLQGPGKFLRLISHGLSISKFII